MLKLYEHEGVRWVEGDYEGRFFALAEDGERLMLETPSYGFKCFVGDMGETGEAYEGACVGVLWSRGTAFRWLHGDPTIDPCCVDRRQHGKKLVTIPLEDGDAAPAE